MDPRTADFLSLSYLGDKARAQEERVRKAIVHLEPMPGLYLITFAKNAKEQLDILPSWALLQRSCRRQIPPIVGAALGKKEAFSVIERMAADAYQATGAVHLQDFLQMRVAEEGF